MSAVGQAGNGQPVAVHGLGLGGEVDGEDLADEIEIEPEDADRVSPGKRAPVHFVTIPRRLEITCSLNMLFEKTRAGQKAATRTRILDAARESLERAGYEGTNLRQVARDAGVSTGAILAHFTDKQDLLHAALFDDLERTWAEARGTARGRSLERDLAKLAGTFFEFYAKRPKLSRALLRESLFAGPPWSERFAGQVAEVHQHVAGLHRTARQSTAAEAGLFGAAFFSFYYFALLVWLQGGHPNPLGLFRKLLAQHLEKT